MKNVLLNPGCIHTYIHAVNIVAIYENNPFPILLKVVPGSLPHSYFCVLDIYKMA